MCARNRQISATDERQKALETFQGFCDGLKHIDTSQLPLSHSFRHTQTMQNVVTQCNAESLQIQSKLTEQHNMVNKNNDQAQKVVKTVGNYNR